MTQPLEVTDRGLGEGGMGRGGEGDGGGLLPLARDKREKCFYFHLNLHRKCVVSTIDESFL